MKKIRSLEIISVAVLLVIIIPAVLAAETSNRIVAVVNNNVITLYELNNKIEEVTGFRAEDLKSRGDKSFIETQKNVLNLLIDEKITQEKIRELGIQVSPDQVDATIEDILVQNQITRETLISSLENEGISLERYREMIKNDLERNSLINYEVKSKILIREEKVQQYYEDNRKDFTEEARVDLAVIVLNNSESGDLSEKTNLILSQIDRGENFKDLVIKYSEGPGAQDGGELKDLKISQLDPRVTEILENMKEGEVSTPIKNGNSVQIIKLLKKMEAKTVPFENAKDEIFDILYKEEVNKRYASWLEDLRKNTYTKINL